MNEFTRVLKAKQEARKRLSSLSFGEKVALIEKMRDRGLLLAKSPLRKQKKQQD